MRTPVKVVAVLCAALLVLLGSASPSNAHAALASSTPADGATLDAPPTTVELTFNEELLPDTVEIAVTTEDAGLISGTTFNTAGPTVTIDWSTELPGDTYKVAYRVVSNDGHPITGAISFSYPAGESTPTEIVESEVVESEVVESDTVSAEPVSEESVSEESVSEESGGLSPVWLIVIGLLVGAVIGFLMWRRAARRVHN